MPDIGWRTPTASRVRLRRSQPIALNHEARRYPSDVTTLHHAPFPRPRPCNPHVTNRALDLPVGEDCDQRASPASPTPSPDEQWVVPADPPTRSLPPPLSAPAAALHTRLPALPLALAAPARARSRALALPRLHRRAPRGDLAVAQASPDAIGEHGRQARGVRHDRGERALLVVVQRRQKRALREVLAEPPRVARRVVGEVQLPGELRDADVGEAQEAAVLAVGAAAGGGRGS